MASPSQGPSRPPPHRLDRATHHGGFRIPVSQTRLAEVAIGIYGVTARLVTLALSVSLGATGAHPSHRKITLLTNAQHLDKISLPGKEHLHRRQSPGDGRAVDTPMARELLREASCDIETEATCHKHAHLGQVIRGWRVQERRDTQTIPNSMTGGPDGLVVVRVNP
jgi:hypothetical protein